MLFLLALVLLPRHQRNQRGPNAAAILCDVNLDLLLLVADLGHLAHDLADVVDVTGVELDKAAINADVDGVVVGAELVEVAGLDENGAQRHAAQPGGTLADGVDEDLDGVGVVEGGVIHPEILEQRRARRQVVRRHVRLDRAQEARVQAANLEERRGGRDGLAKELDLRVARQVDQRAAQELAEEHAGHALLEHLHARVVRLPVQLLVVLGVGQHAEVVVEAAPFGVDDHLARRLVDAPVGVVRELGDALQVLNVRAVRPRAEDGANHRLGVAGGCVRPRHERADGVVHQRRHPHRQIQLVQCLLQHRAHVFPDGVRDRKPLGPSDQRPAVNGHLVHGETKRKP